MGLGAGEELLVEELLWGLLIPSGNDAAMALARHHSGQVGAFVEQMNLRAGDLGMYDTLFHNPNGFDADGQVSSAHDSVDPCQTALGVSSFPRNRRHPFDDSGKSRASIDKPPYWVPILEQMV